MKFSGNTMKTRQTIKMNREFICQNCKEFVGLDELNGICPLKAKLKGFANRSRAEKACRQFNPITDNLPPVPGGAIDWIDYFPGVPLYGGEILVRWIVIDQHGKTIGKKYTALKTPYDGRIPVGEEIRPDEQTYKHIPTHFAYIGEPKI